nr:uncharacterized mitochondrial protein AtMg00810-like [Tanacetum cinerariifolium]
MISVVNGENDEECEAGIGLFTAFDFVGRPPSARTHYVGKRKMVASAFSEYQGCSSGPRPIGLFFRIASMSVNSRYLWFFLCSHGDFLGSILGTGIVRDKVRIFFCRLKGHVKIGVFDFLPAVVFSKHAVTATRDVVQFSKAEKVAPGLQVAIDNSKHTGIWYFGIGGLKGFELKNLSRSGSRVSKHSFGKAFVKCLPVERLELDEARRGKLIDLTRFRGMVGSLMYLSASRTDIVFVVCMCAQYQ